jgi:hypothetical protein
MSISIKSDVNYTTYGHELWKMHMLAEQIAADGTTYVPLTTTGNVSWTSDTSSITYDTSGESDPNIVNKGTSGLLYWLKSLFLLDTGSGGYGNSLLDASYLAEIVAAIVSSSAIYAEDAGASDTYAISLPNAPTSITSGFQAYFKANTANTGACTLNINGLGAIAIKTREGNDLRTGMILADSINAVTYDGTNFCLMNSIPDIVVANLVQYKADAEASDTYVITLDMPPAAYYEGMTICFSANTANTTAATINVNSLGAKDLKDINGAVLVTGAIGAGQIVQAVYDGTDFIITSVRGDVVTTNDTQTISGKTLDSPIYQGEILGWINPNESWAVYTETKEDADISTANDTVTTVDIATGTPVMFTTAAPTGLSIDTIYYAFRVDSTHIQFASSLGNAVAMTGGSATPTIIDITAVNTGTTRVLNIFDRVTISGNQISKYVPETRLKWTQNSVVLYDTVISSSYSSSTVVRIRGDLNWFGNYAISNNYYSNLYVPSGYTVDSGWIAIPYDANYDAGSDARYRKKNGVIMVRGAFVRDSGNITTGDNLGILPAGYRPRFYQAFGVVGTGTTYTKVGFSTDGVMTVFGTPTSATTNCHVDEATFPVD